MRYIILNKPYGVLSQFTPEIEGQKTLELFNLPPNVYAAGRLDKNSEGLLLLTNDGPFIKMFLDHHPRTYWAQVEGIPSSDDLNKMRRGLKLKDGPTKPCKVNVLSQVLLPERDPPIRYRANIPTTWLELILTEGRNRQVRRMTAAIGYPTLRLVRTKLGHFQAPNLPPGEWIEINKDQLV
ncbi:MAG: pseudouridine synthase [Halobacteriovoraceae bacterium]|nr:pseudouridine synthase [Halobacteriovoraceae bacterium]MCB9093874.1 pseudouridine synthase [Halobacteriovoraceae bacterium]